MGLLKRRHSVLQDIRSGLDCWYVAVALVITCLLFAGFGSEGRETYMYDRLAIADGEYWRLLTGHFVHLGATHLVLNLAGLVLVWLLVGRYYTSGRWSLVLLITIATVSGFFWFVDIHMLWYVGLSGVLHGLLLAGAVQGFKTLPSESAIIVAIVIGKLAWEQFAGPLPGSESVSGGNVVVNAHLFGGIGGLIAGGLLWRSSAEKRSI